MAPQYKQFKRCVLFLQSQLTVTQPQSEKCILKLQVKHCLLKDK